MRAFGWALATAALLTLAGLTSPSLGADDTAEHHFKFKFALAGGDSAELELQDLAVGESRQLTTEQGKPVTILRTETGFDIDVDGKKIQIAHPGSDGVLMMHSGAGTEGHGKKIIVRSGHGTGEGGTENISLVIAGEGEASASASAGAGEPRIRIHKIQKMAGAGGETAEVIVRGLSADGEEIELENLASGDAKKIIVHRAGGEDQVIDLGGDGQAHVVVIKKRVEGCEGEQEACEQVEVRVEKRSAGDADQDEEN